MAWLIKTSFLKHFLPLVSKALNPCDFLPIRLMSLLPGVLCCLLPTSPDAEHHCSWTPHLGSNSTPSPCPELRSLYGAFDVSCVLSSLGSRLHPPCLPEVQNCIFRMLTIITSNARHFKKKMLFSFLPRIQIIFYKRFKHPWQVHQHLWCMNCRNKDSSHDCAGRGVVETSRGALSTRLGHPPVCASLWRRLPSPHPLWAVQF